MTTHQILYASLFSIFSMALLYSYISWKHIKECYTMWFKRDYWTDYNTIEFISWFCKAVIIVPGLIFGVNIWQFYYLTLVTSATLIWASRKKALPTLVGFNTMWFWLSSMVLAQHIIR